MIITGMVAHGFAWALHGLIGGAKAGIATAAAHPGTTGLIAGATGGLLVGVKLGSRHAVATAVMDLQQKSRQAEELLAALQEAARTQGTPAGEQQPDPDPEPAAEPEPPHAAPEGEAAATAPVVPVPAVARTAEPEPAVAPVPMPLPSPDPRSQRFDALSDLADRIVPLILVVRNGTLRLTITQAGSSSTIRAATPLGDRQAQVHRLEVAAFPDGPDLLPDVPDREILLSVYSEVRAAYSGLEESGGKRTPGIRARAQSAIQTFSTLVADCSPEEFAAVRKRLAPPDLPRQFRRVLEGTISHINAAFTAKPEPA